MSLNILISGKRDEFPQFCKVGTEEKKAGESQETEHAVNYEQRLLSNVILSETLVILCSSLRRPHTLGCIIV